jgi:phosphatidylglycerophosphate synthase
VPEQGNPEDHPKLSKIPTDLSMFRLGYGLGQAIDLLTTSPEDRTWRDATESAGAATTDKVDGYLSKRYGSTPNGPLSDRMADVACNEGARLALSLNGEISSVHSYLGLNREFGVQVLRSMAVANKQPEVAVGPLGRQKTAAHMLLAITARSPLAKEPDLLETLASYGTALSLMSGAGYTSDFLKGKKPQVATDTSRNGEARHKFAGATEWAAEKIDKHLPKVMPNHLTKLGEYSTEISMALAVIFPELRTKLAATGYLFGGLIDGVDGNLARKKNMASIEGMLEDVRADKRQEIFTALCNSLIAYRNGNMVGARNFAVAAMTASMPAYYRACAEAGGYLVSEDASGSRVIRGIEGGIGVGMHMYLGIVNTVSAAMVLGNISTASQRADVASKGEESEYCRGTKRDPEFMLEGAIRRDALEPYTRAGMALGATLLAGYEVAPRVSSALKLAKIIKANRPIQIG